MGRNQEPPPYSGQAPETAALLPGARSSGAAFIAGVTPLPQIRVGVTALARAVLSPHITAVLIRLATLASTFGPLHLRIFVSRLGVLAHLAPTPISSPSGPPLRGQLLCARSVVTPCSTLFTPALGSGGESGLSGLDEMSLLGLVNLPPGPLVPILHTIWTAALPPAIHEKESCSYVDMRLLLVAEAGWLL